MSTTKKWGEVFIGILFISLIGLFVVAQPGTTRNQTFAQDQVLLSSASDLHPTDVFSVASPASSLPEVFQAAGHEWHPEDKVVSFPDPSLRLGSVITVQHALPITLVDGKQTTTIRTWASTVAELLAEKKILLGKDDKIAPNLATQLANNTTVTITRVAVTEITTNSVIPFGITKKNDNTLDQGKVRIDRAGVNGTLASTFRVTREDGTEVSRVLLSTAVISPPQDQILIIGTKPVITRACAGYNNIVLAAAAANSIDPNLLCKGLMIESNGHTNSIGGGDQYYGLFQYTPGFWGQASAAAGYGGADWADATAQIKVTAWALAHGFRSRWPW